MVLSLLGCCRSQNRALGVKGCMFLGNWRSLGALLFLCLIVAGLRTIRNIGRFWGTPKNHTRRQTEIARDLPCC
jgi:hypothetical protein